MPRSAKEFLSFVILAIDSLAISLQTTLNKFKRVHSKEIEYFDVDGLKRKCRFKKKKL